MSLHIAALSGDYEWVQSLLSEGIDPNVREQDGRTALHHAAERGHSRVAGLLLEKGANVNAWTADQQTALHLACRYGHCDVIEVLLLGGADAARADLDGLTPLHCAAFFGQAEAIMVMVLRGVRVDAVNKNLDTPLHLASYAGHVTAMTSLLLHKANPNALAESFRTPLHHASAQGHYDAVLTLLTAGARTDAGSQEFTKHDSRSRNSSRSEISHSPRADTPMADAAGTFSLNQALSLVELLDERIVRLEKRAAYSRQDSSQSQTGEELVEPMELHTQPLKSDTAGEVSTNENASTQHSEPEVPSGQIEVLLENIITDDNLGIGLTHDGANQNANTCTHASVNDDILRLAKRLDGIELSAITWQDRAMRLEATLQHVMLLVEAGKTAATEPREERNGTLQWACAGWGCVGVLAGAMFVALVRSR